MHLSEILPPGLLSGDNNSIFLSCRCPTCNKKHLPGQLRLIVAGAQRGLIVCAHHTDPVAAIEIDHELRWYIGVI